MKYTINSNTIDVEYIANGKRKQLKLKTNDNVDMDFFNQLMNASSNKRDAMCDLFQRKILKIDDEDTVHIQPMKLDKELKPTKYTEKQELNRRKEELERDKMGIKREIDVLVKDDAKNKDVKSLTKTDLNDETNEAKLKELQRKYMEIDKIHQMIVNQIDSLEINTADSVNIKELKNLTVNAFDSINKSLVDAKISEQDKEDIANKISNVIVPKFEDLNKLINKLKKLIKQNKTQIDTVSKEDNDEFIEQYKQDFKELANKITEQISELPKDSSIAAVFNIINEITTKIDDIPAIEDKLDELDEAIKNLPNVFDKKIIEKREITLQELVDALKQKSNILSKKISSELIDKIKLELPDIDPSITYVEFKTKIFKNQLSTRTEWKNYKTSTIDQFTDLAFKYDNYLYIIEKLKLPINYKIVTIHDEKYDEDLYLYKYSFEDINNLTVGNFINHVTMIQTNNILIHHNPNIYISADIGVNHRGYGGRALDIPVFRLNDGDKEFVELLKAIQKNEPKSDNTSEGISGRIMIDLNKSTTDEKLNEIIRLLSQMNYNVFTTTPMYKNNRYTKSPKPQQKQDQKQSKGEQSQGIDLYDILDL